MIVRALAALWLAWCFARPTPLSCDMQFPPTRRCDAVSIAAQLTEDELDRLAFEADERIEPLVDFAARIVPVLFPQIPVLPEHWRRILAVFEGTRNGDKRWCINMPPRHGKTVCGMLAMAWQLANWPALRHAYATYGQEFSEMQGRTVLARIFDAMAVLAKRDADAGVAHPWPLVDVATKKADVIETRAGGALYITSRDSPLLGKGVSGLMLIDDPYKNDKEAGSPVVLETVWDWWSGTARSRLEGTPSVVLMHQRWGLDDMTGRLEENNAGWSKLVIPAIDANGNALWPAVKPLKELRSIEHDDIFVFSSMYQQEPIPRGNTMFREPSRYDLDDWLKALDPLAYRWCIALDPAVTAKTSADHSAALLCAFQGSGEEMKGWAVDLLHLQVEAPELIGHVIEMRRTWMAQRRIAVLPIVVEGNGVGAPIYQAMRKLAPADQVIGVPAATDKKTRATPLSAAWNNGRFLVPLVKNGEKWAHYVREHRRFTGQPGGKDDRVDVGAHAWNREFRRTPTLIRGPRKILLHGLG